MTKRSIVLALSVALAAGWIGLKSTTAAPQVPELALLDQVVQSSRMEIQLAQNGHRRITGRSCYLDRYYYGDGYRAAKRRCDDKYESYSWDTDMIQVDDDEYALCPFVKPYCPYDND